MNNQNTRRVDRTKMIPPDLSNLNADKRKPMVLLVENDDGQREKFKEELEVEGFVTVTAVESLSKAFEIWDANIHSAAIVDMLLSADPEERELVGGTRSMGRATDGEILARYMHTKLGEKKLIYPIFGMTLDREITSEWFRQNAYPNNGIGVYSKHNQLRNLKINLFRALRIESKRLTVFIVHGNDLDWLDEFKRLARMLNFEPITVESSAELPHRHWLDKIEALLEKSDLNWVIHSPDDWVLPRKSNDESAEPRLHARPNVLFEHGLLFGKLGRDSGRIWVFQCGKVEMPSDVHLPVIQVPAMPIPEEVVEKIRMNLKPWI